MLLVAVLGGSFFVLCVKRKDADKGCKQAEAEEASHAETSKTRIVALAGQAANFIVHRIRITSQQVDGQRDPQLTKFSGDGRADVRNVFKACKTLTLLLHLSPPSSA